MPEPVRSSAEVTRPDCEKVKTRIALEKIRDLKRLADEHLAVEIAAIGKVLASESLTSDERKELLWMLYWEFADLIAVPVLAEQASINHHQLLKKVSPAFVEMGCDDCGEPVTIKLRSRFHLQEQRRERVSCIKCSTAKAAVDAQDRAQRTQQYEEQHRETEARVQQLRTMPYAEYLQTPEWKGLRYKKLRAVGFCCEFCSARINLQVHHRTYERRGCERLDDLRVLCDSCHGKLHGKKESA
ncbi:MAG: HNH endonuclease signature motif containing protein [Mycobacteriales bacterium]